MWHLVQDSLRLGGFQNFHTISMKMWPRDTVFVIMSYNAFGSAGNPPFPPVFLVHSKHERGVRIITEPQLEMTGQQQCQGDARF